MSDVGKTEAIEILRREVGFGCPVCRSPFLTWHHFDPPEAVEEHWRPEGIVALCLEHHGVADAKKGRPGAYSVDQLRAMKRDAALKAKPVEGDFLHLSGHKSPLVRIGGCYTDIKSPAISVNEIPQIAFQKDSSGQIGLNFVLRNRNDDVVVKMESNWFTAYPSNVHDMIVTPKTKDIRVWLDSEDVGLEFSFDRLTPSQLDERLRKDFEISKANAARKLQKLEPPLPSEVVQMMRDAEAMSDNLQQNPPSWVNHLPDHLREAYLAEDKTAYAVKQWVRESSALADGLIPFINFEEMALNFHGERIAVKDGIGSFAFYNAAFGNKRGAVNIDCRCHDCRSRRP